MSFCPATLSSFQFQYLSFCNRQGQPKTWKLFSPFHAISRAFFNHLLRAVHAPSALFEKWNPLFSTKISKKACRLGGCSVLNALNLEKWGIKTHNCALFTGLSCPFFCYTVRMPLFSRISPVFFFYGPWKYQKISIFLIISGGRYRKRQVAWNGSKKSNITNSRNNNNGDNCGYHEKNFFIEIFKKIFRSLLNIYFQSIITI